MKKYYLIKWSSQRYLCATGTTNDKNRAVKFPADKVEYFQDKYIDTVRELIN